MPKTKTIRKEKRIYINPEIQKMDDFVSSFRDSSGSKVSGTFDSAASEDFISSGTERSETFMPHELQVLLDEIPKSEHWKITKALFDTANAYEAEHGTNVPADVMAHAIHMAYGTSHHARAEISKHMTLDDASSSLHVANLSLQPNRAIVAILAAMNDAIPFAMYLPADIGSNEARTAILTHQPGQTTGGYVAGSLIDGISAGRPLLSPERCHTLTASGSVSTWTAGLSNLTSDFNTCIQPGGTASDGTVALVVPLLRGRSILYVNGQIWGGESTSGNLENTGGNNVISGSGYIAGTLFNISGTINTTTGSFTLNSTNAAGSATNLPIGVKITVEGYIDYEASGGSAFIPSIISNAQVYQLYAKSWQTYTQYTAGASSQMNNELGLDPYSESLLAIQNQFTAERHYMALTKGLRLGVNNALTFDFAWATGISQGAQKTRAMIVQDMQGQLGALSQQMAINTMSYGISHLYVDATMAAIFQSLPSEMWVGSGVQVRPGIYRVGRLFGQYDVYYAPLALAGYNSTGGVSQILCIGRAPDVTRNPIILGDAVPPTVIPLGVTTDAKRGAAFYARNFTSVNPHGPSSQGFAVLNVTNVGL